MNQHVFKSPELPRPPVALPTDALPEPAGPRKRIAAITTAYYKYSHADDIITKFIEGYGLVSRVHEPHCDVVSLYLEQTDAKDIGRGMAARYEIPMFDSVRDALTLGGDDLAVDGVVLVGEHGEFEINQKGQKLYPRRRLFGEIVNVFQDAGRSVPVFNDKHLAYTWNDAEWMYRQSVELGFPLMAGSSVPLAWRLPPLAFATGVKLESALSVYYAPAHLEDGVDYASYHTLETLQAFIEQRSGGEAGVSAVQVLEGDAAWNAADSGEWSAELLSAALGTVPPQKLQTHGDDLRALDPNPVVILVDYTDGFRGAAYLTRTLFEDEFCFAARVEGMSEPVATLCHMIKPQRDHFSFLCNHIEFMFRSGRPSYPVERTLLVGGILEAAADSRFAGHTRIETPHLMDRGYQPPHVDFV